MGNANGAITWEDAVAWLRAQPDQQVLVQACFYDDPLLDAAKRFYDCSEWRAVRALLPSPSGRALDVGAGRGIATYALARDGWSVSALEPDSSALVGAQAIRALMSEAGLPAEIVTEWGEALPFRDASFDVVHCRQVLHHARDLPRFVGEVARVLKPGGLMVATREHVISRPEHLQAFLDSHPLHKLYGGENAFLLRDYHAAITGAGLALTTSLNPLQSDINLYPSSVEEQRKQMARAMRVPLALIPNWLMRWRGDRLTVPGRLYSFVAEKR